MHTDGNEQLSVLKYGPGNERQAFAYSESHGTEFLQSDTSYATSQSLNSFLPVFVCSDGNFLAIGSHDNYIYIYAVSENGRKYSRVGKCSVSA